MEALEAPTPQINEEPQEALQVSIPSHVSLPGAAKRKRARSNNYDHLIKALSGGDAVMVFQNEAAMATETVHKEEEGMVEEVARERRENSERSLSQTSLELSVDKNDVVKVAADHAREPVIIAGDKEPPLLSPAADNGAAPLPLALAETTQPQKLSCLVSPFCLYLQLPRIYQFNPLLLNLPQNSILQLPPPLFPFPHSHLVAFKPVSNFYLL